MLQYCPTLVFYLHQGSAARPFLASDKIQFPQEASLLLTLNDGPYLCDGLLVILLLRDFQSIGYMFLAEPLTVFLVK
jgi:hypothetical protein